MVKLELLQCEDIESFSPFLNFFMVKLVAKNKIRNTGFSPFLNKFLYGKIDIYQIMKISGFFDKK
ncbi:hypothetical protein CV393_05035 [Campylobacter jejuni subsp. jejuni]|nr:hypothetical protein CV393_05035 [Campylobacter jejuni subsp. jejuni]